MAKELIETSDDSFVYFEDDELVIDDGFEAHGASFTQVGLLQLIEELKSRLK